jgi:acyl-CoA dehydrogenase
MSNTSIYDTPDHDLLRDQVAKFIAREVEPHADQWEEQGFVPREVLRRMGQAGLFGLMYEEAYGGAEADALTNLVFAEALSQHLRRLHHHRAGPHRHGQPAPAPRGHTGAKRKVPEESDRR